MHGSAAHVHHSLGVAVVEGTGDIKGHAAPQPLPPKQALPAAGGQQGQGAVEVPAHGRKHTKGEC